MAGYGEAYLEGLQHMIPLIRLQELERNTNFNQRLHSQQLQRQYDQMLLQERSRAENQRRLQDSLEETRRSHSARESLAQQALIQRLQQQLEAGSFERVEDSEGRMWAYDKRRNTMVPLGGGPAGAQGGGFNIGGGGNTPASVRAPRPLPIKEREDLSNIGGDLQKLVALSRSFKPEYTNALGPQVGRLENIAKQYLPGTDTAQPDWWRQYEEMQAIPTRHAMFGGSVTRTEMPLWERGAINPGMKPDDVIRMLNSRVALLHRGLQRRLRSASGSYNRKEVEAAAGMPMSGDAQQSLPDLNDLAAEGARLTGRGRPPLEQILGGQ